MMRTLVAVFLLLISAAVSSHELRPAYLELREGKTGEFHVLWKTPMRGDMRLALAPEFSGRTDELAPVVSRQTGEVAVQTWSLRIHEPLRGQSIRILGLESTMTDALVRVEFADGKTWIRRLTPQEPAAMVPVVDSGWSVAGEYLKLGIEHILLGIDHLLFVLALLLIVAGWRKLVLTITAFTLAHSMTLVLAATGFVHIPQAPVEAVIALSIVFVAAEILRARERRSSITMRAPWMVAFAFGLLHGLGFAGALSEIGLPEAHIVVALLFFNVGVEIGQLLFVAAALVVIALIRRYRAPEWAVQVPPYAIGSMAMFWVIQRVAGF